MILGIGIDICKIERIKELNIQHPNFSSRILTPKEIELTQNIKNKETFLAKFLAKRWAAKEAFSKATKLGISEMGFQNIEIINQPNGQPQIKLSNILEKKIKQNFNINNFKIHISISDEAEYSTSIVILEKNE